MTLKLLLEKPGGVGVPRATNRISSRARQIPLLLGRSARQSRGILGLYCECETILLKVLRGPSIGQVVPNLMRWWISTFKVLK